MSIIYRPNRDTLEESLREAIIFGSELSMREFIANENNRYVDAMGFNPIEEHILPMDVIIGDDIITDNRTGWGDCRTVCLNRGYGENYIEKYARPQVIGYCATIFSPTQKIRSPRKTLRVNI